MQGAGNPRLHVDDGALVGAAAVDALDRALPLAPLAVRQLSLLRLLRKRLRVAADSN